MTERYRARARLIARKNAEAQVRAMRDALEAGARTFQPDPRRLASELLTLFQNHRDDVVRVGISDGIQEVSPENKLGLWLEHPILVPVEDTLSVSLANFRDDYASNFDRRRPGLGERLRRYANSFLDQHLSNIRKAYARAAQEWLSGDEESSIEVVKVALQEALQSTDFSAERTFRTETTNYFNESRQDYFSRSTAVDYMQLFTITDGRRSKICEDRHGWVITIDQAAFKKYMPAFHPHCRTIQRPLISRLSTHKRLIEDGEDLRRRTESSATPLPKGWGG